MPGVALSVLISKVGSTVTGAVTRKTSCKVPSSARTTEQPSSAQITDSNCRPRFVRTMKRLSAAAGFADSRVRQRRASTMRRFMDEVSWNTVFHRQTVVFNTVFNVIYQHGLPNAGFG